MASAERVLTRYLEAAVIGDPNDFIDYFATRVADLELPQNGIEAAKKVIQAYGEAVDAGTWDWHDQEKTPVWGRADDLASKSYWVVVRGWQNLQDIGHKLFLSILQTLALPPAIRKKIEMASRLYLKTMRPRIKNKGWQAALERLDIYEKFWVTIQGHLALAKQAILKGKAHAEEGPGATKVRVGSFVLVNTGGFNEKVMGDVVEVMKKSEALLKSSGFEKVCYGEVQVTNTISKANTLAFYLVANDELFVRANVKDTTDSVRTVLHELGHRFEHKFLQGKRRDVEHLYHMLSGQERDLQRQQRDKKPKPGETWVSPNGGKEYRVLRTEYGRGTDLKVIMERVGDPSTTAHITLEGFLAAKGQLRKVDEDPDYKGYVTEYAKRGGPSENLAEMFAFYCMGRLPTLQSVPFEELCFGQGLVNESSRGVFYAARRVAARWILTGSP